MKKIVKILLLVVLVLIAIVVYRTFTSISKQPVVEPAKQLAIHDSCINHLSQAIQIKTVSAVELEHCDTAGILQLHGHLQQTYPLVHKTFTKTVINKYSLLYHWPGKNTELAPIILIAHMDVVPVEDEVSVKWDVSPFSGTVKDGFIWGRGALDDKGSVIAILETIEELIKNGFTPNRTIYIAFGHDEEVGGMNGAAAIAKYLKDKQVKADFLLDEGMVITDGIVPGMQKPVALVGIAEKGYLSLRLNVNIPGGHSSMPDKSTAIGILSQAINNLQNNPFPAVICKPVEEFMNYIGPEMPFVQKMAFANPWLFKSAIIKKYLEKPSGAATVRTTTAPTIINGGVKDNVLPPSASAIVNFRILPEQTIESTMDYVKKTINDDRVEISIYGTAFNPSPVSNTKSSSFKNIEKTIKQVFPEVVTAPSLMLGGTDSKHYVDVADNVYRFMAVPYNQDDLKRLHGANERIRITDFKNLIRFYHQLIVNYN